MVCVPPSTHNKYICGHQSVSALENEICSTLGYVCTVPPYTPTPTPTPIPLLCSAIWGDNRSILCVKISPLVGVLGTCAQTYTHIHTVYITQCTLLSNHSVHYSVILYIFQTFSVLESESLLASYLEVLCSMGVVQG